jgi:arabinose-5-phosphate isomerase
MTTGLGKSGHVARKVAATLASTGTLATFLHAAEASHGDLGMIGPADLIIAFSWSGETVELRNIISYSRRFRVTLIAITSSRDSTLGASADICLELPQVAEACPHGLAPTTSATVQMVFGDALAMALLSIRKFRSADFHRFHPGGKLGSALMTLEELMHDGDALPLAGTSARMADAILTMTEKAFGILAVVDEAGELAGVITDGDLRRSMSPGLLGRTAAEIMTKRPRTMLPSTLAGTALGEMNAAKITAILVVRERRPVGVVHIHDLLRAGVV